MKARIYLLLLIICTIISCNKDDNEIVDSGGKYVVNANKIIAATGSNYSKIEPQVKNKDGYRYIPAQPPYSNLVKAEIYISAVDDSSKREGGTVYFNVLPDNTIGYAQYATDSLPQSVSYAMMLNYHRETLATITGITNTTASYTRSGLQYNASVDTILFKLRMGVAEDRMAISYKILPRGTTFSLLMEKSISGRYQFGITGNW